MGAQALLKVGWRLFERERRTGGLMIYRDPKCVFVAESVGLAEVVVIYLADHDIAAQVMNPTTLGGLDGLTWLSRTGVGAGGIEVWVRDPAQATMARELLEDHAAELTARTAEGGDGADITVICEDCGKENVVPGRDAGKVVNCQHCEAYMDVPDASEGPGVAESEDDVAEES
jgi:hypothetical protein